MKKQTLTITRENQHRVLQAIEYHDHSRGVWRFIIEKTPLPGLAGLSSYWRLADTIRQACDAFGYCTLTGRNAYRLLDAVISAALGEMYDQLPSSTMGGFRDLLASLFSQSAITTLSDDEQVVAYYATMYYQVRRDSAMEDFMAADAKPVAMARFVLWPIIFVAGLVVDSTLSLALQRWLNSYSPYSLLSGKLSCCIEHVAGRGAVGLTADEVITLKTTLAYWADDDAKQSVYASHRLNIQSVRSLSSRLQQV